MRRHTLNERIRAAVLLIPLLGTMGCDGCGSDIGKEAAQKIADAATNITKQLPAVIESLDKTLQDVIGKLGSTLDKTLTDTIQETSRAIHAQIDALHDVISGTIKQVDAMLAARIKQLTDFAIGFTQELRQMLDSGLRQLQHTAQTLVTTLGVTGNQLLEQAGYTVVKSVNEGGKVVLTIIGGVVETTVLVIAGLVFGLSLIFGGIFFVRTVRKRGGIALGQLAPGGAFFLICIGLGTVLLFSRQARATVASGTLTFDDGSAICAKALQNVLEFRVKHSGPGGKLAIPKAAKEQAECLDLLADLFTCEGTSYSPDLRHKAQDNITVLQSGLGLDSHCRQATDCNLAEGQHCDTPTGFCISRCEVDAECQAPGVCHAVIGSCGPLCADDAACQNAGLRCDRGHCVAKSGVPPTPPGTSPGPHRRAAGLIWRILDTPAIKFCVAGRNCPLVTPAPVPGEAALRPRDRAALTPRALPHGDTSALSKILLNRGFARSVHP
jgi:hypothetical protein